MWELIKSILELIEKETNILHYVRLFNDESGVIVNADTEKIYFEFSNFKALEEKIKAN